MTDNDFEPIDTPSVADVSKSYDAKTQKYLDELKVKYDATSGADVTNSLDQKTIDHRAYLIKRQIHAVTESDPPTLGELAAEIDRLNELVNRLGLT